MFFSLLFLFFFFFQAEDGIRDTSVTGVQTCALPISECEVVDSGQAEADLDAGGLQRRDDVLGARRQRRYAASAGSSRGVAERMRSARSLTSGSRSEERRVGKECRARRAAEPVER